MEGYIRNVPFYEHGKTVRINEKSFQSRQNKRGLDVFQLANQNPNEMEAKLAQTPLDVTLANKQGRRKQTWPTLRYFSVTLANSYTLASKLGSSLLTSANESVTVYNVMCP